MYSVDSDTGYNSGMCMPFFQDGRSASCKGARSHELLHAEVDSEVNILGCANCVALV